MLHFVSPEGEREQCDGQQGVTGLGGVYKAVSEDQGLAWLVGVDRHRTIFPASLTAAPDAMIQSNRG